MHEPVITQQPGRLFHIKIKGVPVHENDRNNNNGGCPAGHRTGTAEKAAVKK